MLILLNLVFHFFKFGVACAVPKKDAASMSVVILKKKLRGQIFLGCDNHPLSRFRYFAFFIGIVICVLDS